MPLNFHARALYGTPLCDVGSVSTLCGPIANFLMEYDGEVAPV